VSKIAELFNIHGAAVPRRQLGESNTDYRRRTLNVAQSLLPADHPWASQNLRRQPDSALDAIERAVVDERVNAFKSPTGPLREVNEVCPRTGRVTTKFYGDPAACWDMFAPPVRRLARFTSGVGRGKDSERGRALLAARAAVLRGAGLG
jgi:hypothetical protein